jgi:hypothetical protein
MDAQLNIKINAITDESIKQLQDSWDEMHRRFDNSHKPVFLEEGMAFFQNDNNHKIYCAWCGGSTPDDSQGACIACGGPREIHENRHQAARQRYAGGFLTVNEIRVREGFPPVKEMD